MSEGGGRCEDGRYVRVKGHVLEREWDVRGGTSR